MMKKRATISFQKLILILVALSLCGAICMLLFISISPKVNGINLKEFAKNRNTVKNILHASRGGIYDKNGDALALSVNSYTLIAYLDESRTTNMENPHHVVDKAKTANLLAPILNLEESKILEYLNKKAYQVEFGPSGKNLTESEKKTIENLNLPGLDFISGSQRYYKMGDFASYIIGYAKLDEEGSLNGELGLEGYYNDELSGKDGYEEYEADAKGHAFPGKEGITVPAQSGSNIYLTIDSNIQIKAENALKELSESYEFDWAVLSVLDAKTGAIVASSTMPSFNPNNLNTLSSYLNPLVSFAYEPGSTMKTFSWASAIEEGIYDGNKIYESGSIKVADATISDANKVGWGKISFDTGYAYSSNTGATNLALELGAKKLYNYYDSFGFGKKTDIELAGEVKGTIDIKNQVQLATASFGQGIAVTPIQLLQGYTMITNDGVMLKPYIVDKIVNENGEVTYEGGRTELGQKISKETAKKMRELMHDVNYNGLMKVWRPKTVNLALKTGTAQISSKDGGYLKGDHDVIYSIAGFFPEDNPKYIVYAAVQKINSNQVPVAKMATKFVDDVASYAKITETKANDNPNHLQLIANYKSKTVNDIEDIKENFNVITLGSGDHIISQYPNKDTKIVKDTKVFFVTNKSDYVMPNIIGWSRNDIKTLCSLMMINVTFTSHGYAKSQSIPEGTPITSDLILNVELE